MRFFRYAAVLTALAASGALAEEPPASPTPKRKDELRMPFTRGNEGFLRQWLIAGPLPCEMGSDCVSGEASLRPAEGQDLTGADGTTVKWRSQKSWGDEVSFDDLAGPDEGAVAYAFATVSRTQAAKALLSLGTTNGVRVWLNGRLALSRDGLRSAVADEDQVEVEMNAGDNALLVKTGARSTLFARVLEPGTVLPRYVEIGPSIVGLRPLGFTLQTDIGKERPDLERVGVEVVAPGGKVVFATTAPRGAKLDIDARSWPDGPYEVRCSTRRFTGLLYATHLPWYKGDSLAKARDLATAAAAADPRKPEGFTLRMLVDMVEDRLQTKLAEAKGNPWRRIHSPLMEFDELMLEQKGLPGRIRPHGFVRLAYRDEVDGSPQFCRAYLPADYDKAKKWPLVIQLHGYNGANPVYVRWWSAGQRHPDIDTEFSNRQGVIYMEPHGRGNTQYLGMGDGDVLLALAEAKRLLSVDDDRVYLTGDSMGGWGTWNVASRHPDLFAAIAPVFGGVDYHSVMSEEELGKLSPLDRFFREKESSWAMADGLLNVPIFVLHGDADAAVDVAYSRWALRLLQRWGYDVRYHEFPGRVHEALERHNANSSIEWFLRHERKANPSKVRIRSAELRNASAYWVRVRQAESPLDFMLVDAEVVDRNVIRLDTRNVLDIELWPSALVDVARPIDVVWNGVGQKLRLENGGLRLTARGYEPALHHKSSRLPGTTRDFTTTPFAIVIGTVSKDPEMVAVCKRKAEGFIAGWREWQKHAPRVFEDTEMSDSDMARYSLLLVGGPEANSVSARLAAKLPLQIAADRIIVDGKAFPVEDGAVQMIYPNPLNLDRYVLVVAGTSSGGMFFAELSPNRLPDWEYTIADGHIPAFRQAATALQTRVVSGMFDHGWRYSEALAHLGDAGVRAKARKLRAPNAKFALGARISDAYVGHYQIEQGPQVEVYEEGTQLKARQAGAADADLMLPVTEVDFVLPNAGVWISFVRDESGRATGLTGYSEGNHFAGKRID